MNRRTFLKAAAVGAATLALPAPARAEEADRQTIAVTWEASDDPLDNAAYPSVQVLEYWARGDLFFDVDERISFVHDGEQWQRID